jgi:putative ABC transport system substrate-binding protein
MAIHIRRREFIFTLGGAAAAWPLAARAQQAALPVIGFLHSESSDRYTRPLSAFRRGLGEAGYFEGRSVAIDYRWADEQYERLPALAAELVQRRVAVIATPGSTVAALAAKAATTAIPIVFLTAEDPVARGLVDSLNKPGGNLTGVISLNVQLAPKQLEFLHELVPTARVMALLINPAGPLAEPTTKAVLAASKNLGLTLHVLHAVSERDFDAVFAKIAERQVKALVIGPDALFTNHRQHLGALAARYALPASAPYRDFAAAGGLLSYGDNIADSFRLAGFSTGQILRGAKPADLPVHQSTKVELTINLKTANKLGLTVPISLLGRADEVIE